MQFLLVAGKTEVWGIRKPEDDPRSRLVAEIELADGGIAFQTVASQLQLPIRACDDGLNVPRRIGLSQRLENRSIGKSRRRRQPPVADREHGLAPGRVGFLNPERLPVPRRRHVRAMVGRQRRHSRDLHRHRRRPLPAPRRRRRSSVTPDHPATQQEDRDRSHARFYNAAGKNSGGIG